MKYMYHFKFVIWFDRCIACCLSSRDRACSLTFRLSTSCDKSLTQDILFITGTLQGHIYSSALAGWLWNYLVCECHTVWKVLSALYWNGLYSLVQFRLYVIQEMKPCWQTQKNGQQIETLNEIWVWNLLSVLQNRMF
jgi:hypothetical protein